jgi:hypothetical protein
MGLGDEAEAIRDAKVMHARLLRSRVPSGAVQSKSIACPFFDALSLNVWLYCASGMQPCYAVHRDAMHGRRTACLIAHTLSHHW